MRTITKNLYSFSELSDDAKQNAIQNYRNGMIFAWQDEIINTICAIAKAIYCDYDYYSYDGITYTVSFTPNDWDDNLDLKGVRAWAYIENNFITPFEKPKTYWLNHCLYTDGRKNWSRKSKINKNIWNCVFTGYCADDCYYWAWEDWKKHFTKNSTVRDFIDAVADALSKEWSNDNEYQYSDEGIIENLINTEYEFYEDGEIY